MANAKTANYATVLMLECLSSRTTYKRILRKFGPRVKRGMRLADQKSQNLFLKMIASTTAKKESLKLIVVFGSDIETGVKCFARLGLQL